MKKFRIKRLLCLLLAVVMITGLVPQAAITVEAGYEDGAECEYCGGYRFDDWLCDCGPHCSETSDSSDCYEAHHCKDCGEAFEEDELCEYCGFCDECARAEQGYHCIECGEHFGDTCQECYHCIDCALEKGYHCEFCMECGMGLDPCGIHPFGNDTEAHCIQCSPTCMGCGACFGEDISEFCFFCEKCLDCAMDSGNHCGICEWCYEGELCEECLMCDECAVNEGAHCETCGIHVEEWCTSGGEGTHCMGCAEEFACAQCEACTQCLELDICEYCGLCMECCIQNAEEAGCSCGEYCIEGSGWEEHFCEECNECFDNVDVCEYCGMCVDCCEQVTECSNGMCVENPDYDQHFCEECNECFCNTQQCEECYDGGFGLCEDCCAQLTEAEGCEHGYCTNSWEWDEHFCYNCGMCFEICGCPPIIHDHEYDDENVCTICHARKDGGPVIVRQPEDARCMVFDTEDPAYVNNYVTFTVKAVGEGLSYQWYNATSGQALTDELTGPGGIKQCEGAKTDTFKVFVTPDACSITYRFYCIVTNEKGSTQSDTVKIDADHNFNAYAYDKSESFEVVYDKLILPNDRERELSKTFYVSDTHWKTCSGCDATEDEAEHRLGPWLEGKEPNLQFDGYKYKICYDCGYEYGCVLPKLTEPHVHDFTYSYGQGNDFHWGQCVCAKEDKTTMERHTYGDWVTKIEPTISTGGTEERSCTVCGHIESRETKPQGHVHQYYDWDYINENGYIDNDSLNVPYMEPYGKTDKNYHYAYCVASGCKEYKKIAHNYGAAKWITYPTEEEDGKFYKQCGACNYEMGGSCPAGKYQIVLKDCRSNVQVARPGATVKLYPLKNYPEGKYFAGGFDITYTDNNGAYGSWKIIECECHNEGTDDEYWSFEMPKLPEGATWETFWVEVIAEVNECEDHEFAWANVVEETCGTPGYTGDYMCKLCNYVEEAGSTVPPTGEHGELYEDNSRPGSCTRRGYSGDLICEICEKVVEKGHYTDFSHGRNIGDEDKRPQYATCTENGFSLHYICEDCGKVTKQGQVIKKLGHEWTYVEKKEPTCEEQGWEAHYICNRHNYRTGEPCGAISIDGIKELVNKQKVMIPALGHEFEKTIFKPTCTEQGYTLWNCTVCGHMEKENFTEATDHVFGEFVSNGDGTKSAACKKCHYAKTESDKKASGNLGGSVTWYIDGKGTLYIEGIGVATKGPWAPLAGKIKAVVFDEKIKNVAEDGLDGIGKPLPIYIYGNDDLMNTLQESGFTNVVDVYKEDVTITLDASYLMLTQNEEVTIQATTSHPVKIKWFWEPDYVLDGAARVNTCNIRGIDWGTDYVVATVELGDRTISAHCRVDVTEEKPAVTIEAAHLIETSATSKIYSKDYAEFDVSFDLAQNMMPAMSVMSMRSVEPEVDTEAFTDQGVSVEKAQFTNETVSKLFRLKVKDDKTLQIIPLIDVDDAAAIKALKSSYKSTVNVTVNGQEYTTKETLTLKTSKTVPSVKVNKISLNSFYDGQTKPLIFTSKNGNVIYAEVNEVKATAKTPAIPNWLELNEDMTVSLKSGYAGKASGKLYLNVGVKGWTVPAKVEVSVSAVNTAPKLKLSATSTSLNTDRANAVKTKVTLLSNDKKVAFETIGVTDVKVADVSLMSAKNAKTYAASANYVVESYNAETGDIVLELAEGCMAKAGKILLEAYIDGATKAVQLPFAVSVYSKAPAFKLSKTSISLSTIQATETSSIKIKVVPTPADYKINGENLSWTITDSKNNKFDVDPLNVTLDGNNVTVNANSNTQAGAKYKVTFKLEGCTKAAVLNVTVTKPSFKLAKTSITVSTLAAEATSKVQVALTSTPKDYVIDDSNFSWVIKDTKNNVLEVNKPLDVTFENKVVTIASNGNSVPNGKYKVVFTLAGAAKTVTLNVTVANPTVKLAKTSVTLNALSGDSATVAVTTTPKDYVLTSSNFKWKITDSKNNVIEPAPLDVVLNDKKVTVSTNDNTQMGKTYKVVYTLQENNKSVTMTVKTLAEAKSKISLALSVKGKLKTGVISTGVTVTPKWTNRSCPVDITENIRVYAKATAKGSTAVDVTEKFIINKVGDKYEIKFASLNAMKSLNFKDKYTLKAENIVIGTQNVSTAKAASLSITHTKPKVTQSVKAVKLYQNDRYSRGMVRITLNDNTLPKISEVRIAKSSISDFYEVISLNNGWYALKYKGNQIAPKIKSGTVKLNLFLEGNNPENNNPNATVSVKVTNVKFK